MSILIGKNKVLGHTYQGGGKGGGGGGNTTTSTSQTSNIPDYAQPYVENMLESTQRQIYTTDPVTGERTGFTPYVPYSKNASDYLAPFQPMQVQAQQGIKNLQVPGAINAGAMGSLFAGQNYANQMQDPASMASYMNPYQQGVTDIAKNAAVREAQMAQNASNLGAARQGTYGGARQTLANSERERNLMSNLSNIQAQGSNQAYQQAIANQQFGAGLGMQGYGQAGQLAGQGLKAQQDLYGLQNQYGGQQQAQEQQKISQSIQDFANQQQYPLMQLGTMSNMLRGLPMQSANTNQYVAAPNAITQGIGLAGAGASIYNALKREGGVIKEKKMASGGIAGYSVGGSIRAKLEMMSPKELQEYKSGSPAIQDMVEEVLRDKTGQASGGIIAFANPNEENNQGIVKEDKKNVPLAPVVAAPKVAPATAPAGSSSTDYARYISDVMGSDIPVDRKQSIAPLVGAELQRIVKSEQPRVNAPIVAAPPVIVAPPAAPAGILQANSIMPPPKPVEKTQEELDKGAEARVKASNIEQNSAEARKGLMAERANAADEARRVTSLRMAEFFGAWGSTPGNTIVAGLNTLKNKIPDFVTDIKDATKIRKGIDKDIADLDKLDREEKRGIRKDYFAAQEKIADRAEKTWAVEFNGYVHLDVAKKNLQGHLASANRATDLDRDAKAYFDDLVKNENMDPNNPATMRIARQKAREGANPYAQGNLDVKTEAQITNAEKNSEALKGLKMDRFATDDGSPERIAIDQKIAAERQAIRDSITKKPVAAPAAPAVPTTPVVTPTPVPTPKVSLAPAPVTPITLPNGDIEISSGPKKGTYQPQADGTYKKVK